MAPLRVRVWLVIAASTLAACGSAPGVQATAGDASSDAVYDPFGSGDATASDGAVGDGPHAAADAGCTPVQVGIALSNPDDAGQGCKFSVEWTCGDKHYRITGGCGLPGSVMGGKYEGVCVLGEAKSSTFEIPTSTCACDDGGALGTLVQAHCVTQ